MDAIFKVPSAEFNEELFNKIAALLKGRDADVTIAVHDKTDVNLPDETEAQYWNRLSKAVTDIEEGKGITVSMEELDALIDK